MEKRKKSKQWLHEQLKMRYKHYFQSDGASWQRGARSWEHLQWDHLQLYDSGREREFVKMGKNFSCPLQDSTSACSLQRIRNVQGGIQER